MGIGVAGASVKRILVIGDSLTEGYGIAQDLAFPAILQQLLAAKGHRGIEVINAGISGSTTAGAQSRLEWQLRGRPDLLILALGANDGLRGLPVAQTRKNLVDVIGLAQKNHIPVLLAGMHLPPNYGAGYAKAFADIFPSLAKQYHLTLMPFLLQDVAGERDLNQEDGIHPNEKGHAIIAQRMLPYVLPFL